MIRQACIAGACRMTARTYPRLAGPLERAAEAHSQRVKRLADAICGATGGNPARTQP
jgi:hypothetical protein